MSDEDAIASQAKRQISVANKNNKDAITPRLFTFLQHRVGIGGQIEAESFRTAD